MGSQSEAMHGYEQMAPLADHMLLLTRTRQWGELPARAAQYGGMVAGLKAIEAQDPQDEAQSARKCRLLSRSISSHDEICSFVMPPLATLGDALERLGRQQSLRKACGEAEDAPS